MHGRFLFSRQSEEGETRWTLSSGFSALPPDGEDGSTELMIIGGFVLVAIIVTWRRLARRNLKTPGA